MTLIQKVHDLKMSQFQKANVLSEKADGSRDLYEFRSEFWSEKQMASANIYDINKGALPEDVPISKKQMSC